MEQESAPAAGAEELDRLGAAATDADVQTLAALAQGLAAAGDLPGAVLLLRGALELQPREAEIRGKLGLLLNELGFRTEALWHLNFAARHSEDPKRWRRRLLRVRAEGLDQEDRRRIKQAFISLAEGRPDAALGEFRELTQTLPQSTAARLGLQGALHALDRKGDAAEAADRWRQASPPHRAGVEAALARPMSRRGLVIDPREPLPVRSMGEVLTRVESAEALRDTPNSYFEIDPGGAPVDCTPAIPLTLDRSDSMDIRARTSRKYMARFDDALLAGRGLVVTRDGEVISDLIGARTFGVDLKDGMAHFPPGALEDGTDSVQVFDSPAMLMAGPTDRGYGDWVNQYPPRLAIAEAAGVDCPPVLRADLGERYFEMLTALGVDRDRLMLYKGFAAVFPQLYVPSWPLVTRREPMAGWFDVYRRAWAPPPAERRRIFLSRRDVGHRALINEPEIAEIFARRGFDIVMPETLDMDGMIKLFAGPSIVAGPYGSAMRSLVFCRQKPTVFTIMPPYSRYFIEGSGLFFDQMGVRFGWVRGRRAPGADPALPNDAAWTISPEVVEEKLDRLLDYLAVNAESR